MVINIVVGIFLNQNLVETSNLVSFFDGKGWDLFMHYKGYLIDLDGTMYRGNEEIAGAKEFIQWLMDEDFPYVFITNNSSLRPEAVVQKLAKFGIITTSERVLTSAIATAQYVQAQKKDARCFVIGEDGLQAAIQDAGLTIAKEACDYVVVGIDRELTYDKLKTASLLIQQGATFVSTNRDAAIPTEDGLVPGNGAITALLAVSSGVEPIFIGKPEKIIMDEALQMIQLARDEVLMVGDNYTTDILAGIKADIDTLMVLTGFSDASDLQSLNLDAQPTYVMEDLFAWMKHLSKVKSK